LAVIGPAAAFVMQRFQPEGLLTVILCLGQTDGALCVVVRFLAPCKNSTRR
jgi:hypothetical protein